MSHQNLEAFAIYQNIHFIGIGGIGISALARILAKEGHNISGSDLSASKNSDLLISEGIKVKIGAQVATNIPDNVDLIIFTTAIPENNPELIEAKSRQVTNKTKLMNYPQAVGQLTQKYRTISISGTHGKTTTTAMVSLMLEATSQDPTVIVGSLIKEFDNKNERLGNSELLVLESCEYQEAFLNYYPKIIILNNIDPEHLDYFGTEEKYLEAYRQFIQKLPEDGILIANGDDRNIEKIISEKNYPFSIFTFGKKETNNYQLIGKEVKLPSGEKIKLSLAIPGEHNLFNSMAAIALIDILKLDTQKAANSIKNFHGAARRFEVKGKISQTTIIDDYGHAPAEISATILAAKEYLGDKSRILCVFQPHQYSRTYYFLSEFAQAFSKANKVLIPNIYKSRDTAEDMARVSAKILVDRINSVQTDLAIHTQDFEKTLTWIKTNYQNYDCIITVGAGDITNLADQIIDTLQ